MSTATFTTYHQREGELPLVLRTLAYFITGAVLSYPLTVMEGVVGGALGSALGGLLGRSLAQSTLRTWVIGVIGVGGLIIGRFISALWAFSTWTKHLLGPAEMLRIGEFLTLFLTIAPLATLLRAFSTRFTPFSILEVAAIAFAFAGLVIEHRNGAIHRPYALADPILARGGDPSSALLGIGALATITLALLLLSEEKLRRSLLQLALFLVFLLSIIGITQVTGLPSPPPTNDGLRLRDDDSRGASQAEQNQRFDGPDFRDDYTSQNRSTPLAIVLLHDDYSPPSGAYYFRQDAFSQFNGNRLVRATLRGA
ncbi:MAG: hypothetical protein RMJ84_13885, partial [Sandaracinaceae bacterium]|nr:hypothetical protein [Sandaracinaceae bacterium]